MEGYLGMTMPAKSKAISMETCAYVTHLFHRHYQMCRELFIKIVKACKANSQKFPVFHSPVNIDGLIGFNLYQKDIDHNEDDCIRHSS